jgi:PAS domain S-box-containing protein
MSQPPARDPARIDEDRVLRTILEGTAGETGEGFFRALVRAVAEALQVRGAWVAEFIDEYRLRARAFWLADGFVDDFLYDYRGTPCATVLTEARLVHVPDRVVELFPDDDHAADFDAVSYIGAPLTDADGAVLGNLAILHDRPLPEDPRANTVFRIFAARAAAELRRLKAEEAARERELELERLVGSAMDAIVGLDRHLRIVRANRSAERVFRSPADDLVGRDLRDVLTRPSRLKIARLADELEHRPSDSRSVWISGGLEGRRSTGGAPFPAEATLSSFDVAGETRYTLILRDVDERLRAERELRTLAAEREYLREEIRALENFGEIIGESDALFSVLDDVRRVAETHATVLLLGETGTGKELFARAIHEGSPRADRPLVRVNCAAIPGTLVESELFGHEKGAFTGATSRRRGRFALADRGTLFLDEVGELPLEVQAKLLRVLQDGDLEPVGGEKTRKVDVRVIAATNRDLSAAVREGRFREDLFYRLAVFPVEVPPLREREDDVVLLAQAFLERFSRTLGRDVAPLTPADEARLRVYPWPGNVRELQNVIERAVITARGGRVELDRVLPEAGRPGAGEGGDAAFPSARPGTPSPADPGRILTEREVRALERENLRRALEATGGQVAGDGGAARLLGLPPSTLTSRVRALGIEVPRD